jgi:hypothetical protein
MSLLALQTDVPSSSVVTFKMVHEVFWSFILIFTFLVFRIALSLRYQTMSARQEKQHHLVLEHNTFDRAIFQVLTVVFLEIQVLWDVTLSHQASSS